MPPRDTDAPPSLEIDWLKTAAGALAAVTTAVLLSTLGAVGTLIGAALGSVAATVGSALYAQGLARSRDAVLKAQETALHKVGIAQAEVRRAGRHEGAEQEAHLDLADERLGEAKEDLDESAQEAAPLSWRERFVGLPWRRVALIAAGTFVVVVLAITAFEALTGESIAKRTGGSDSQGTTIGGVTGNDDGDSKPDKPQHSQQPSPSERPSESASEDPGETPSETPTETPTPTPTPTPTAPTPTTPTTAPTPTTSATPSTAPTPTP
jgi:hypothetical protein